MTEPPATDNAFEQDKPGTAARDRSEGMIEGVRRLGGVFVEAIRAARMAMVLTDPALSGNPIVFANQSFLELSGYSMEEVLGQQPYFMNGPDTDLADVERFRQILASDQDGVVETVQYAKNGRRFIATVLLSAFKDEGRQTIHHFLTWTDVTRRVDAEDEAEELRRIQGALRESEERFRGFADNSSDVLWIVDAEKMQMEYLSPAFERTWQQDRAPFMADLGAWLQTVHPNDRATASDAMATVVAGTPVVSDYRIIRPDGSIRHTGFPIHIDGQIRRVGGIAQDITETRLLEQHQRTLLAELQHRVRNTLGVIRSIARRTATQTDSVEEFGAHFDGRLGAFARMQAMVTRDAQGRVSLLEMVEDELVAHAARDGERVTMDGDGTTLPPRIAERLSLAVHELATNSIKYGALQDGTGELMIRWRSEEVGPERRLVFSWDESGIEVPAGEKREGFGTELLTRLLAYELKATASLDYAADGVRYSLEVPLPPAD